MYVEYYCLTYRMGLLHIMDSVEVQKHLFPRGPQRREIPYICDGNPKKYMRNLQKYQGNTEIHLQERNLKQSEKSRVIPGNLRIPCDFSEILVTIIINNLILLL